MIVLRVWFLLSISYNTQISKDEDLYISKEILKSVDLAGQSSVELDCLNNWNNQLNFYKIVCSFLSVYIFRIATLSLILDNFKVLFDLSVEKSLNNTSFLNGSPGKT